MFIIRTFCSLYGLINFSMAQLGCRFVTWQACSPPRSLHVVALPSLSWLEPAVIHARRHSTFINLTSAVILSSTALGCDQLLFWFWWERVDQSDTSKSHCTHRVRDVKCRQDISVIIGQLTGELDAICGSNDGISLFYWPIHWRTGCCYL